mgnify:CR=1 FL=1
MERLLWLGTHQMDNVPLLLYAGGTWYKGLGCGQTKLKPSDWKCGTVGEVTGLGLEQEDVGDGNMPLDTKVKWMEDDGGPWIVLMDE